MRREVPVHYLRPNHTEWTPSALAVIDTETRPVGDDRDVQAMRCWAAAVVSRPGGQTATDSRLDASGVDVHTLAVVMDRWARSRPSLWVYAHNLGFDLAVTRLPLTMEVHGWTVTDFALDGRSPWLRMAKGRNRITLADSWSWVPRSLAAIAPEVGIIKPPLPADGDDIGDWLARCKADVDITLEMMTQLMDWWQRSGRGRWTVTGAASGWNAYRHIPSPFQVVIDPDAEAVEWDRKAIYGGKRYVNRVGKLIPGAYVEADFARAYTVIARDMPLPVRRMRPFDRLETDDARIDSDGWAIIAECDIETTEPLFPKRDGGRVWYPVGRFRTVLASPEIVVAREKGYLRSICRGYTYRVAHSMNAWARWVLGVIDGTGDDTPAVARMAARQWGRSVVGKWAQRNFEHIKLGPAPTMGWGYSDFWSGETKSRGSIVDIGGQRYQCSQGGDSENAFPAVLAFVESYVRVRLNVAIAAIGSSAFVQCDTDGVLASAVDLVHRIGKPETRQVAIDRKTDVVNVIMERISELTAPLTLRMKSRYSRVEVIGPQHIRLDSTRRFSGIPGSGIELPDGRIGAYTWPRLAYQMSRGDDRGYVREYHQYRVPRALASGWVTVDGHVRPVEYARAPDGQDVPLPWERTRYAVSGDHLAAEQNGSLLAMVGGKNGG